MDQIRPQEIESKKQIGTLKGDPVIEIALKGGLHIVCTVAKAVGAGIRYLGAGPHRAVARWLAKKKEPGMQVTELAKSDHIEPQFFQHMVPEYEQLVDRLNARR